MEKILLATDFTNIRYDKLKHLITFFISGNSRRLKLSKVINDFKNKLQSDYSDKNILQNINTTHNLTNHTPDAKFKKLIAITKGLLEIADGSEDDYKKYIKYDQTEIILYKGVKETDEFLMRSLGIDKRVIRTKNKEDLSKIDDLIKSQIAMNSGDDYELIIKKINGVINTYGDNKNKVSKFLTELGFKKQKEASS